VVSGLVGEYWGLQWVRKIGGFKVGYLKLVQGLVLIRLVQVRQV